MGMENVQAEERRQQYHNTLLSWPLASASKVCRVVESKLFCFLLLMMTLTLMKTLFLTLEHTNRWAWLRRAAPMAPVMAGSRL